MISNLDSWHAIANYLQENEKFLNLPTSIFSSVNIDKIYKNVLSVCLKTVNNNLNTKSITS